MEILDTDHFLTSREKILQFLLINCSADDSQCTVKDIANELDISVNATRQYLVVLEKEGYVVRSQKKSKAGRPAITYSLHESALETFPKTYIDFSVKLLDEIRDKLGESELRELLVNVGHRIANELKPEMIKVIDDKGGSVDSLKDRLDGITQLYHKYGKYPFLIEEIDSYALKNFNCLVFGVVKEDPLVCAVDETLISELVGTKACKERCIRDGDECCLYRIKKTDKINKLE